MSEPEPPSFNAALQELETILERIEREEIDIDRLADELRRATELIELLRRKIRKADVEVTQIVQRLQEQEGDSKEAARDRETPGGGRS
jgi:exodeoxyribonuclease VII small subunit